MPKYALQMKSELKNVLEVRIFILIFLISSNFRKKNTNSASLNELFVIFDRILFWKQFRIDTEKVDWTIDLERGSDGMRKCDQTLNSQDVFEIEGSKGDANYIMKWEKGDKSACNISIIEDKTVRENNSSNFKIENFTH